MKTRATLSVLAGFFAATVFSVNASAGNAVPVVVSAGNSGGGGNATAPNIATKFDVYNAVKLVPMTFKYYLATCDEDNRIDVHNKNTGSTELRILSLYFNPKLESPYDTLKKAKLTINITGPCYYKGDPTPEDASADATTQTICMSVPRLTTRKFDKSVLATKLTSLYAHEFAHLRGLTHSNADEALAEDAQTSMFEPEMRRISFDGLDDVIMNSKLGLQDWLNSEIKKFKEIRATKSFFDFCQALQGATSLADITSEIATVGNLENPDAAQQMGMNFTPTTVNAKSTAALIIMANAFNACDTVAAQKSWFAKAFRGQNEITIMNAMSNWNTDQEYSTAEVELYTKTTIPQIKFGPKSRATALFEFNRGLWLLYSAVSEDMGVQTPDNCKITGHDSWGCGVQPNYPADLINSKY